MTRTLSQAINDADAIVIGGGAGLSSSGGLIYGGERFERLFPNFIKKYGLTDMYSSGFYPFETEEELWAYWSKHIYHNRFESAIGQVYFDLLDLVKGKSYFVITTNADHQFIKSGFDKDQVFEVQGDYGKIQCANACHDHLYDNEKMIRDMFVKQEDCRIPSNLVPVCPQCSGSMTINIRKDQNFVEDHHWHSALKDYQTYIKDHQDENILFIELGVGTNTPDIIKYSFWKMTHQLNNATYACLNMNKITVPHAIRGKSILLENDIGNILKSL